MTTETNRVGVERFDHCLCDELLDAKTETYRRVSAMESFELGDYVRYSDYAAMLQQLAELRSEVGKKDFVIHSMQDSWMRELFMSGWKEKHDASERAMREACGLLREAVAWTRAVPIDHVLEPNLNGGKIFGRIAAFLAANGEPNGT